jgi:DNA-binding SARP family transcriptional activator/tetratricopeptide (TPR) repeat protein
VGVTPRVRLLGPVDVMVDGAPRPVNGLRLKAILAALALRGTEVVSVDWLVDVVWAGRAPRASIATLQSHLSRLRRVLGDPSMLVAQPPGYLLRLGTEGTDVQVAERLIDQSAQTSDPRAREARLRAAVDLWRGAALADLAGLMWFDDQARRLDDLRRHTQHALVDARLALGQHRQLIPDLEERGRRDPLDEQTHGQLILSLYRSGRQADALATYERLRRSLGDELGIDPSAPLRDLQAAILRQDPDLDGPRQAAAIGGPVPAQLPPAIGAFAGRDRELVRLDALLAHAATSAPIAAISGTAGVGKTTLAVHWAHRAAARFPDGQLYLNLRGFDPAGSSMPPAEAVHVFLDALGVSANRIPSTVDARIGLYRSLLAGRRILVMLDNARDAEQVQPLLPGSAGCLTIVTSRSQLASLIATEGAHPVAVDLMSDADARDLLARRLGPDRTGAEPAAVAEIAARCARLPLALAVVAARAATRPTVRLAALAAELRGAGAALDALPGDARATDVRAVFSWSYRTLSPAAARLFRLLGRHPGPDIGFAAAASLAGRAAEPTGRLLTELAEAHLLAEHRPGRYLLHDLLRAYAAELSRRHDDANARRHAVHRVLDHYLHSMYAAATQLNLRRGPMALQPPRAGVRPEPVHGHDTAMSWCSAEHAILLATVELAVEAGFDRHAVQLASVLSTYLLRSAHWQEQVATQELALSAARRLGDRSEQARALRGSALAYARAGRLEDADRQHRHALELFVALDDPVGQALAHTGLAMVAERRGQLADSLRYNELALEVYRTIGNEHWQANALNGVGWSHALLGNHTVALAHCTQALTLLQRLGDREGQAHCWDSLGYAYQGLADYERAFACYRQAIDLCHELGDRYWEADSLRNLGSAQNAAGQPATARKSWRKALDILSELDHPDADELRAKLHA